MTQHIAVERGGPGVFSSALDLKAVLAFCLPLGSALHIGNAEQCQGRAGVDAAGCG